MVIRLSDVTPLGLRLDRRVIGQHENKSEVRRALTLFLADITQADE
jgi:hypothetical protein